MTLTYNRNLVEAKVNLVTVEGHNYVNSFKHETKGRQTNKQIDGRTDGRTDERKNGLSDQGRIY